MKEHEGVVTMKGEPITLLGDEVNVGDKAPSFTAVGQDLSEVEVDPSEGKVLVIFSVGSLETSVCDVETKRFNEEAGKLGKNVKVIAISMDLPMAQKRWCGVADVENVEVLSDHRDAEFGEKYGVLIKGLRLLARSVFVVDKAGVVQHRELVHEVTQEPDYEAAPAKVKELA